MTVLGLAMWLPQVGNLPLLNLERNHHPVPGAARSYNVFRAPSVQSNEDGIEHLPDARSRMLGPQRGDWPCSAFMELRDQRRQTGKDLAVVHLAPFL